MLPVAGGIPMADLAAALALRNLPKFCRGRNKPAFLGESCSKGASPAPCPCDAGVIGLDAGLFVKSGG